MTKNEFTKELEIELEKKLKKSIIKLIGSDIELLGDNLAKEHSKMVSKVLTERHANSCYYFVIANYSEINVKAIAKEILLAYPLPM